MRKIIAFLIFISFSICYSQTEKYIDSLSNVAKQYVAKEPIKAIVTYYQLAAMSVQKAKFDVALKNTNNALTIAEKIKNERYQAILNSFIGEVHKFNKNNDLALIYKLKALAINEKIKPKDEEQESIIKNDFFAICMTTANIYTLKKEYKIAETYFAKCEPLLDNPKIMDIRKAQFCSMKGTNQDISVDNIDEVTFYSSFSNKLKAIEYFEKVNPKPLNSILSINNDLANDYYLMAVYPNLFAKCKDLLKGMTKNEVVDKSLTLYENTVDTNKQNKFQQQYSLNLKNRAELYSFQNKNDLAYNDFKEYHRLNDSLYSQENKNKIAKIESDKEISEKENLLKLTKIRSEVEKKKFEFQELLSKSQIQEQISQLNSSSLTITNQNKEKLITKLENEKKLAIKNKEIAFTS